MLQIRNKRRFTKERQMTETWHSKDVPPDAPDGPMGWIMAVARTVPLIFLVFGGLILLLIIRLFERPLFGLRRPVTPFITQFVCRNAFRILGVRYTISGTPLIGVGAMVANHSSWLDVFALNAAQRIYFVSKAEVAAWPGIGWLARATGTVFIKRDRREATKQVEIFRNRLSAKHRLVFFPEGTSTDGLQVLPFKPTLFAAFFTPGLYETLQLQAVTLVYTSPAGKDPRFYGWWGNMDFAPHLLSTLTTLKQGQVEVIFHDPVALSDFENRKTVAAHLEKQVRSGLPTMT